MSARPSEIRGLLARAKAAQAPVSQDDPEVKARILKNRQDAEARKFVEARPFTDPDDLGYDPSALRATMKAPAAPTASAAEEAPRGDSQEDTEAPRRKKRVGEPVEEQSKADLLRSTGFDGLAELEDMQNSPLGSTSALSGPGSRRMISSPARSVERQARRYSKMGRAGQYAAADLMKTAASMRISEPGLRTQAGVESNQTASSVADSLAQRAITGATTGGNEMPPNKEEADKFNRKKRKGSYMGEEARKQALNPYRQDL